MARRTLDDDAFTRIIVSNHADQRIRERVGHDDLDHVRAELREAILRGRWTWRARNIFYVWVGDLIYVLARHRHPEHVLVVITLLLTPDKPVERSGPPIRPGLVPVTR